MKLASFLFLTLICCSCSTVKERTNSQVLWPIHNSTVVCEVHEQSSAPDDLQTRELLFTDSYGNHITAIRTPDSFLSMYPISDESDLFVTVWVGGSAYHIRVFTWKDNKPYCVLDDGSKNFPEIVFDAGNTFFFLSDAPGGPDNPTNWKTKCYQWNGETMAFIKEVSSGLRFEDLKHWLPKN